MAIAGFLKLAGGGRDVDPSTPLGPTREGAYALGRGEARGGRSMDSLLAAYRVGARVSWRELAQAAAEAGLPATTMAKFAELLFAYIDELSAASVAGHTDELTTSGRVRDRYRERLGQHLLAGAGADVLTAAAARAEWTPPTSLTAVLLPAAEARRALAPLGADTLQVGEDLQGMEDLDPDHPLTLLLVPDADGPGRRHLLRALGGRHAVVGPPRPWIDARSSYDRAARTLALRPGSRSGDPIDSEQYLADLVLTADPAALADLRAQVLAHDGGVVQTVPVQLAHLPHPVANRLRVHVQLGGDVVTSTLVQQPRQQRLGEPVARRGRRPPALSRRRVGHRVFPNSPPGPAPRVDNREVRLRNFPCWVMGHMYRRKPGDKEMLVCQRCGKQELLAMKRMRDNADRPGV